MLSNFETARDKLIQIILSGQPQLADNIGSPELLQMRQRISIFARLMPFTPEETALYIRHRLRVAGYDSDMPLFTKDALAIIAESSEGIPRNINNLCFNALTLGCALQQKPIDREVLRQVVSDLSLGQLQRRSHPAPKPEVKAKVRVLEATSITTKKAVFSGMLSKIAVAAVLLVAVSTALALFESQRSTGQSAAQPAPAVMVKPDPVVPVQPAAPSTAFSDTAALPPAASPLIASSTEPAATPPSTIDESDVPPPASLIPPADLAAASQTRQPEGLVRTVQVAPGQTLLGICIKKFGNCTSELLRQIHELNPSLNNPDHIESGQSIRVPVLAAQSSAGELASPGVHTQ
jgi:general secretion pathway protein A